MIIILRRIFLLCFCLFLTAGNSDWCSNASVRINPNGTAEAIILSEDGKLILTLHCDGAGGVLLGLVAGREGIMKDRGVLIAPHKREPYILPFIRLNQRQGVFPPNPYLINDFTYSRRIRIVFFNSKEQQVMSVFNTDGFRCIMKETMANICFPKEA